MRRVNLLLWTGAFFIAVVAVPTVISFFYTPYDPVAMQIDARLQPPSQNHWFGTDQYGRDLFSRIITGGQTSLSISAAAVGIGMVVGTGLGAAAGYFGKKADELLMRTAEALHAFPSILLALLAVAIIGPGGETVLLSIAIANIPVFIKITRASFMQQSRLEYVLAARALGASDWRIMFRHILPNSIRVILIQASASFASALLAEASLSYLGLGVQPPQPSWGKMLREVQSFGSMAPWTVVFPGMAVALVVLGFNLVADGLRIKGK